MDSIIMLPYPEHDASGHSWEMCHECQENIYAVDLAEGKNRCMDCKNRTTLKFMYQLDIYVCKACVDKHHQEWKDDEDDPRFII